MPRKELSEDFPLLFDDGASSSPRKSTINYSEDGNISPSRRRPMSRKSIKNKPPTDKPTFKGKVPPYDMDEKVAFGNQEQVTDPPKDFKTEGVAGFENLNFEETPVPNTSARQPTPKPTSRPPMPKIEPVTHDQARSALREEVSQHFCWGKGPINDMSITNIGASSAFHYTLQTFTEGRSIAWGYDPYDGGEIDGPQNGPAPPVWDVPTVPQRTFQDATLDIPVPHTESLKKCFHCLGHCQIRCHQCCGRGRLKCAACNGSGRKTKSKQVETCSACFGTGRSRCKICVGHGEIDCTICEAVGQLKLFVRLTVTWSAHDGDHIVEKTALPKEFVAGAQGSILFQEEDLLVPPITDFCEESISVGSQGLILRHSEQWKNERILRQRHNIRWIPVSEVRYVYKSNFSTYWVYGLDQQAHSPDYPAKLLWGCTLL